MHASLFLTPITVIVLFYIDSLMAYICLFLFSGKGNKMNIVRRIGAVLLSLLMIVGITTQSVSAASYKMEWHGKSTAYGSTVGNFTIDGRRAWCIEHKKTTPSNQTMSGDFYTSTEPKYANIRKIMYYGWFGYQTWDGMNGLNDDEKKNIKVHKKEKRNELFLNKKCK